MRINHNIAALNTYRQLTAGNNAASKSMEKLSSGLRINRAGDDAAGLAISEKMRGQIRGLDMASKNAQDGISLIQTAEGALNETHSILQRMRELAVQAASDSNTDADRNELQEEMNQLVGEIDRISTTTEFNTMTLLDGSKQGIVKSDESVVFDGNSDTSVFTAVTATNTGDAANETIHVKVVENSAANGIVLELSDSNGNKLTDFSYANGGTLTIDSTLSNAAGETFDIDGSYDVTISTLTDDDLGKEFTITGRAAVTQTVDSRLSFHIGANSSQTMSVGVGDMSSSALNIENVDVTSAGGAEAAISAINHAIEDVSSQRSQLGAFQNRLEHTINNLGTSAENLTAAESRIRDVDMAKEMMEFTKNNILSQAAQSMLAQANQQPQGVLQLLR
ncbi:flagellin [Cytobacillus sp. IB215316]|uniref:flagellin N-terminal helical domain-containing protein n=1 Tax=Cytobacillus sp. IB215316 TaxID=3097354 RepID=UPI002A0AD948|nr:flagellin [Cytobacillus sp. IB215316]MDX8361201.1 flagellin [Cytobacillus sp. IB215316]